MAVFNLLLCKNSRSAASLVALRTVDFSLGRGLMTDGKIDPTVASEVANQRRIGYVCRLSNRTSPYSLFAKVHFYIFKEETESLKLKLRIVWNKRTGLIRCKLLYPVLLDLLQAKDLFPF